MSRKYFTSNGVKRMANSNPYLIRNNKNILLIIGILSKSKIFGDAFSTSFLNWIISDHDELWPRKSEK